MASQSLNSLVTHTVDGINPAPVEVGSLPHYLQGLNGFDTSQVVQDYFHQQYDTNRQVFLLL